MTLDLTPGTIIAEHTKRWRFMVLGCPHAFHYSLEGAELCARDVRAEPRNRPR